MQTRNIILIFLLIACGPVLAQTDQWQAQETEADTLLNRKDYAGAVKLYSKLMTEAGLKANHPVYYKRAIGYYSLNEYQSALGDLDPFIAGNPDKPRARLLRAFIYKALDSTDLQIRDLTVVLENQPSNIDLLKWRAAAFLEKEDYKAARIDLLSVKAVQDDPETELYLGMTHYNDGSPDSALMSINKAIELDVTYMPSYLYAGSYCLQEDEYGLVLKYMDVALKIEPNNKTALFYKGVALVELQKEKEGCRFLTRALAAGEDDAVGYLKQYCYGVD